MNGGRRWLASRHLRDSEQGRRALDALEKLDPATRENILARGDALAIDSVALAHAWFCHAVVAYADLGADDANRWRKQLERLLAAGSGARTLALAYLDLPASTLARAAALEDFVTEALALTATSTRLAAAYVDALGFVLVERAGTFCTERLHAWRLGAENACRASRWRGEWTATKLLESARVLGSVLTPSAVAAWTRILLACAASTRAAALPDAPGRLNDVPVARAERLMELGAHIAATNPQAAAELLSVVAPALERMAEAEADAFLEALFAAGPQPALVEAAALFVAMLHEMPSTEIELACRHAVRVAREFPTALPAYLRSIARALEEGGSEGVALWVERGLALAAANERAGLAHFRLETRTAHKVLVEHGVSVRFEEIEAVMHRFATMIARRPLHLAAGAGIWLRPPLSTPADAIIRLPERVDLFETSEDNQLFFKLAVAHAAARWQFGTYDFDLAVLQRAGIDLGLEPQGDDIISLLDAFPNPLLAAGLFLVIDGARLDWRLARTFRGLAWDLDRLGHLYAKLPVPAADRLPEALIEALFLLSVGGATAEHLPVRLRSVAPLAERTLARVRRDDATVYDSVRLLASLYGTLSLAQAVAARDDDDLSTFVEIGGATVIDPLEDDTEVGPTAAAPPADASGPKIAVEPRGEVPTQKIPLEISADDAPPPAGGLPLTPEQIKQLIEKGVDIQIHEGRGDAEASLGLYITDLLGKLPPETLERLRNVSASGDQTKVRAWLAAQRANEVFHYDEWDYLIGDYRRQWCALSEHEVDGDGGRYVAGVVDRRGDLIARVRREFFLMRPEQFRKVRGMEDGEDFDLNALVEAHADRRTRRNPTDRIYIARRREERDVATLFLLDMSASTDEPVPGAGTQAPRRVIDVTKETLVVMSAVLNEIGDAYAIYGFSGHGRANVEYYHIKTFAESWGPTVRARIGGIEPKRSTRMGAALRHSARRLSTVAARARHLILLSDGFPQDYDYGDDRRSNVYGIRDTTVALQEIEALGMKTFCITIDPSGHDYLREMCPASRYAVIEDIEELPEALPRIYRTVTRY